MPTYTTETCFSLRPFPGDAVAWLTHAYHGALQALGEEDPNEFPVDPKLPGIDRVVEKIVEHGSMGFDLTTDNGVTLVQGDESPNLEALADLLQAAMQQFAITKPFVFEYATGSSRAKDGAFGGGAVRVTQDEIAFVDPGHAARNPVPLEAIRAGADLLRASASPHQQHLAAQLDAWLRHQE